MGTRSECRTCTVEEREKNWGENREDYQDKKAYLNDGRNTLSGSQIHTFSKPLKISNHTFSYPIFDNQEPNRIEREGGKEIVDSCNPQ